MLSSNALKYTIDHLLRVALPTTVPFEYSLEVTEDALSIRLLAEKRIRIALFREEDTAHFRQGNSQPTWLPSADGKIKVPLFHPTAFAGKTVEGSATRDGLNIPYDIVTPSFMMLSREEEYHELPRDQHNRFLYNYSLARRYEFIEMPLVDEYALLLRTWILEFLRPDLQLKPRHPQVVPTHDIDLLYRFSSPWQAFKSIFGRDLLLNHSLTLAQQSQTEYRRCKDNPEQDPYILAINELAQLAQKHQQNAIFFFKAQSLGEADCTYDISDPNVARCLQVVRDYGLQFGIHGSYDSYNNPNRFHQELQRLSQIAGEDIRLGRQHYLRFCQQRDLHIYCKNSIGLTLLDGNQELMNHHNTLQVWQMNGIQHDYTLGYAEQPGFRCGTCHPYPLYDLDNDSPTDIIEHPLIVMDGSLLEYMKLSTQESVSLIRRLQDRCEANEGDFVILWHNHLLSRNYRKHFEEIYLKTLYSNL